MLLALVNGDYTFLWADIGSNGLASDAQVFNGSELKEVIEDGSIDFPHLSHSQVITN